jgi:very-short-patch-repair endonuclease
MADYQRANRKEILQSAAHARGFKVYKRSGLHEMFKKAMTENGLLGFDSEHRVGFYSVDEANERLKLAVEIDGCYWHGCKECGFQGIRGTQNTDRRKEGYLRSHGWKLLRIPEHEIKTDLTGCLSRLNDQIGAMQ